MRREPKRCWLLMFGYLVMVGVSWSQVGAPTPHISSQPTLFVVGYAHLDTQWRWEYPQVIQEFLPNTMLDNFALFQRYPDYVFNFTGSNRYRMMKEYYPAEYAKVRQYVAEGRWFPAGSSVEENDVNSPSPESIPPLYPLFWATPESKDSPLRN